MTSPLDITEHRCPACDAVVELDASFCLLCGCPLTRAEESEQISPGSDIADSRDDQQNGRLEAVADLSPAGSVSLTGLPGTVDSVLIERRSKLTTWLAGVALTFIFLLAIAVLQNPTRITLSMFPSPTPTLANQLQAIEKATPTAAESEPAITPTVSLTPPPTATPRPPRAHTVASGETLFGLALRYDISAESIARENNIQEDSGLQVNEVLNIPWPTPTPPLEAVEVEINGQTVIADPTSCKSVEIKGGDTLFAIAAREDVELSALLAVNRLTERSILQPGDSVCIPKIIRGGVLPPTPGPSPTPTITPPAAGPDHLYPIRGSQFTPGDIITLQWLLVKDLAPDEWYMVEMIDLDDVDFRTRRGFTRQSSFRVPAGWLPEVSEPHDMRWQVAIVTVTGSRTDGAFTYTFGGQFSNGSTFVWGE